MCGIFGIIATNNSVSPELVQDATDSLAHRGPDDSGIVLLRDPIPRPIEIGLGNRRLAILDLSPLAHQPMHDAQTGNWLVYNGEIYNFREVRNELEQAGVNFVSHSDTEVVLKSYARWGEACLERFRGMFAFAIWDAARHQLFLARDPMGIKPLYYVQAGSYFIFASEVRTILGTGLVPQVPNRAGLLNYLTFGSAYDPHTLIEGVRSLPPGHRLLWKSGQLQQSEYWDLVDDNGIATAPEIEDLQSLLEESVSLQLVSDVPVGVFLSGGIDSSALVSILSTRGLTASTFSIVFQEPEFSEGQYSRAIAGKFQTDHHEISVTQSDFISSIPDAIKAMDLPTMDGVNTYFVARQTRRAGVKVALSGLGGDELFAGYSSFRSVPRLERLIRTWDRLPQAVSSPISRLLAAVASNQSQKRKLLAMASNNGHILHPYFLTRMLFTPQQCEQLFPDEKDSSVEANLSQRNTLNRSLKLDPINRVSYLESRCYMLNTLLRDADCMSMSQGLEVRVPLIDHKLAKAVLALPGAAKLNRRPKKLLVEALASPLPDGIVHRRKRGFTMPFERWMRQELRSEIEPTLQAKRINSGPLGDLLDGKQVQQVWQDFLAGTVSWSRPWSLYVLERWCELHLC